jgi:diguanylate cyclase (GGDEF)-like protein/PAS domain S-box-containing protein
MTIQWTLGGGITLVAAGLSGAVLASLWSRRVLPEARWIWPVMAIITLWSVITSLEAMTPDATAKILLSKLEHICVGLVGPLFVLFALRFSGSLRGTASMRLRLLLFGPPFVAYLFVVTNEWHQWVWTGFSPGASGTLVLIYHHGPMYYVISVLAYAYLSYATYRIVRSVRDEGLARGQATAVIGAMLLPWIASLLYMTKAVPLDRFANLIPLAFVGSGLILAWSLLPSRPLSLMPVARDVLLGVLPSGVITLDSRGRLADANAAAQRLLRLQREDLGRPAIELLNRWPSIVELLSQSEAGQTQVEIENGHPQTLQVVKEPLRLGRWECGGLILLHDVTQLVQMESELRFSERRYKELVETALVGVYITTLAGRILYANERMWRLFGYDSAEEFLKVDAGAMYRTMGQREELLEVLARDGHVTNHEVEVVTRDGTVRCVSLSASRIGDRVSGMLLDVTEQKASEDALRESEERFRLLVERLADAVFITDPDGSIQHANEAACHQTGYTLDELTQLNILRDLAAGSFGIDADAALTTIQRGQVVRFEERKRRKDGTLYWTECALSQMEVGGQPMVLSVNRDVTPRKESEARLQYLSTHDPLTGAYNRGYFEEEMARLSRGRRFPVSVLMADVNGLKGVNDTEGHAAGDQVLRCTCEVLKQGVRAEDVVARIGGDEFAVLLPETDETAAVTVVARIRKGTDAHNTLPSPHRPICMAIGAATVSPQEPLDAALRLADDRMYKNKRETQRRREDHDATR